ncbi:MAG: DUF262 domain-containing protein [Termitinemataceae bacterium]|nr:MAG: DUF262 domain-containing protein [Termitinemataceae bacterium]
MISKEDGIIEKEFDTETVLMDKPFNPSEIDITIKPLTIDLLIKRLKANPPEIELSPEFQRAESLWTEKQQSQLIESLLIKFPLPAFYFDGSNNNNWLIVDGLQRLSAIKNFTVLKTLRLTGLEFLSTLEGKGFDELDRSRQRDIEEAQITAYVINPGTPEEVKFNIFKRLNTGGLVLTSQEIRHALNHGVPAEFIAKLANLKVFIDATGGIPTTRMLDREFVTRFVAFYLSSISAYKPDIDTYMNEKMRALKQISQTERDKIEHAFTASMELAKEVFGKHAFRKAYDREEDRKPINKALFEVWSVSFAKLTDNERSILCNKKDVVFGGFVKLMNDDSEFVDSISSSTDQKKRVIVRYEKIKSLIKGVLAL